MRTGRWLLAAVVAAGLVAAPASASHTTRDLLSIGTQGQNATAVDLAGISEDGSHVFFTATIGSTHGLYQRSGGVTTFLAQFATFGGSTPDGSRVFFNTGAVLSPEDTDSGRDVYEYSSGQYTLISTGPTDSHTNAPAGFGAVSADGSRVIFSSGEALTASDNDGPCPIFESPPCHDIYERSGGTTQHLSTSASLPNEPYDANLLGVSRDATRVFFGTYEAVLPSDTDNGHADIYERHAGTTSLVSTGPAATNAPQDATINIQQLFHISEDGTHAVFTTYEDLTADDTDGWFDTYERIGSTVRRVSQGPSGGNGGQSASPTGISADGSRIFFATDEKLVPEDTDNCFGGCSDIYERTAGTTTTLVSTGTGGGHGPYQALGGPHSKDGSRYFFATTEQLAPTDTDNQKDIYERAGGVTTHMSTGSAGGNGPFDPYALAVSDNGDRLFFQTQESLVPGDTDTQPDIYERHAGNTTLISNGPTGGNGPFPVCPFLPCAAFKISPDGTRAFFQTDEALTANDTGDAANCPNPSLCTDVYAARVASAVGYVRPIGATPLRVSLVPAFGPCGVPNRTHGPPLAFASCHPQAPESEFLTVGTPDANGKPANSSGQLRLDVAVGNPGTPADEADITVRISISDVLVQSGLADYAGELQADLEIRITDRRNGDFTDEAATVQDAPFRFAVPCTPVGGTAGSLCATLTSADAILPGAVPEGRRSVWQLGDVRLRDGGADGIAATSGNTLFARQGLFVP